MKSKFDIVEKHIDMSLILEQKKSIEELNNDKIRTKMSNQAKKNKIENGSSRSPFHKALKEQISDAALTPDIVKWT